MLILENINHTIGGKPILQNVSLSLPTGQVIALIGPNGAGKSTLFSLMARLKPLTEGGRIAFDEHDISTTSNKDLATVVSMLSQENHIQGRLRVKELLMFGRYPHHGGQPTPADHEFVNAMLTKFELEPFAERFLVELSGGQKQRVLIAMVICQDTPYVLLDEPLNNLDMYHAGKLMRILRTLTTVQGKTVVIVLHDINQASQFADTVVMMKAGQVMATGTPSEVLTFDNMRDLFGVEVAILELNGRPVIVDGMQFEGTEETKK